VAPSEQVVVIDHVIASGSLLAMDLTHSTSPRRTYVARFEGGPRHGAAAQVRAVASGFPPDLIRHPGQPTGVYLLAGGPRADGSVPYWWMSRMRLADFRARADRRRGGRILSIP
jgi:hypothetical protein